MTEKQYPALPAQLASPPEWACWVAQDADGAWWAYEAHPNQQEHGWYENEVGRIVALGKTAPPVNCHATLRKL